MLNAAIYVCTGVWREPYKTVTHDGISALEIQSCDDECNLCPRFRPRITRFIIWVLIPAICVQIMSFVWSRRGRNGSLRFVCSAYHRTFRQVPVHVFSVLLREYDLAFPAEPCPTANESSCKDLSIDYTVMRDRVDLHLEHVMCVQPVILWMYLRQPFFGHRLHLFRLAASTS